MSGFIVQDSTHANEWLNTNLETYYGNECWPELPADVTDLEQMLAWLREMNMVTMLVEFRIVCDDGQIFGSEVV